MGKKRTLANIKFIGELFLRELVALKVVWCIIDGMLSKEVPQEHDIEQVLELLNTVGHSLEQQVQGKERLSDCLRSLANLTNLKPRLRFLIQDVLELQEHNWMKNVQQ